jgi:hypothetical protein
MAQSLFGNTGKLGDPIAQIDCLAGHAGFVPLGPVGPRVGRYDPFLVQR